jgi:hypothetical protein
MTNDVAEIGPFVAVGGMAVAFFLYAYAAVALPGLVNSLMLPVVWVALLLVCLRWCRHRPRASVLPPLLAVVAWFAVMLIGR